MDDEELFKSLKNKTLFYVYKVFYKNYKLTALVLDSYNNVNDDKILYISSRLFFLKKHLIL